MKPGQTEIASIQLTASTKAETEEVAYSEQHKTLDCQFALSTYRRLLMRVRVMQGYPLVPAVVEITSPALREKLLEKMKKQAEMKAAEAAQKKQAHLKLLYDWMCSLLYESRFLLCWDEIQKTKKQVLREKQDSFKANDKSGLIVVKVSVMLNQSCEGEWECQFHLQVPFAYPAEQPVLSIKKTNIPEQVYEGYEIEANEIAKRCRLGYSAGYGKEANQKNRVRVDQGQKYFDGTLKKIQQELEEKYKGKMTRAEVKHDVAFLHQQADYKERQHEKQARYNLKKMVAKEKEIEIQKLEEIKEEEKQAFAAVGRTQGEQKSLFAMIDYFLNYFVHLVPAQLCKICEKKLLSKATIEKAYCGHWFHLACLEEEMNRPPFDKQCPEGECEEQLGSNLFPIDEIACKNRERMWAMKQARQAELSALDDDLFSLD